MANVREKAGKLFFDFRYQGVRCREYTALPDTAENRKVAGKLLDKLIREMAVGPFSYRAFFPDSPVAWKFDLPSADDASAVTQSTVAIQPPFQRIAPPVRRVQPLITTPLVSVFAEQWFNESKVSWRATYRQTIRDILDSHVYPELGQYHLSDITRAQLLAFRAVIAAKRGKKADTTLSPARINVIMLVIRQVLEEGADRFEYVSPFVRIKPLKIPKSDVEPFKLKEVKLILDTVRADFKTYYITRFFTGMRTGEIDGLKWKYVDFERRQIMVRETIVRGEEEETKNNYSQRDIHMNEMVYQALLAHRSITQPISEFVFCNTSGQPLDNLNVTKRVWYPLMRYLAIPLRRPYQTRHTAATLWLAAGENPEWIARQMGHANTEMLFTTYSRFVPNLTRQDGSALEKLISPMFGDMTSKTNTNNDGNTDTDSNTHNKIDKKSVSNTSSVISTRNSRGLPLQLRAANEAEGDSSTESSNAEPSDINTISQPSDVTTIPESKQAPKLTHSSRNLKC